ncbi:MAG TPA: hypothetical protein VEX86_22415 [Longimicrobium sp.]|nr:hypothetical protein [Longimicrobium sp.]
MSAVTPLRSVRRIDLTAPPATSADDVMRAIAAELAHRGNVIVHCAGGTVEFDTPAAGKGSGRHRALRTVEGGSVTVEAAGPVPRVRVELRYSISVTYLFPALVTLIAALADISTAMRLLMMVGVALLTWFHCGAARAAYHAWIADGALAASPRVGSGRTNLPEVRAHG